MNRFNKIVRAIIKFANLIVVPTRKILDLDNVPQVQSEWRHHQHRLPGQRFDGEQQCHLMYGPRWRLYNKGIINGEPVNICRAIWCRNHINLKSPNAAALQVPRFSPESSQS